MRPVPLTRTAALASLLVLEAAPLAADWTAAEILAKSKEAHGGAVWDRVQTLVMDATFFPERVNDFETARLGNLVTRAFDDRAYDGWRDGRGD